jgi:hypothetical protein
MITKLINDHGFEVWADNKIVNFIEKHGHTMAISSEGHMSLEDNDHSISSTHATGEDGDYINIVLRANVEHLGGWKKREWSITRK